MLHFGIRCPNTDKPVTVYTLTAPEGDPATPHLNAGTIEECEHCGEAHDWKADAARDPTGPEDAAAKPVLLLGEEQARAFRELTADHPYGVGIMDEGAAYATVLLYDADGKVADHVLVFPDGDYGRRHRAGE